MSPVAQIPATSTDVATLLARLTLLEEENRWLKARLFGRSSEKAAREEANPGQAWL
jgi:hypothetical protein